MKDLAFLEKHDSNDGSSVGAAGKSRLAGLFMQLRKCCLHPYLFDGAEENIGETTIEELIGASGKLAVLDSLLRSLFQKGHRCVLFSQFTSVLDIISDYCTMRGWRHVCFDGRTPRAKRNYYVNSFNAKNSPIFLFVMSTRSGSMGLNLQTADTVVLFDSDFNPQMVRSRDVMKSYSRLFCADVAAVVVYRTSKLKHECTVSGRQKLSMFIG
jgi:SWI/SNF-related matrix-associated actin-dependent regulator of chromatin subfamily A member 5